MTYNLDASGWFVGAIEKPNAFRLIRLLGIGGESQVWLSQASEESQDADSAHRYAIKIFHTGIDSANGLEWMGRFNEIKTISNPVMAKIYEAFIGPDPHPYQISNVKSAQRRYLIMEYVDGPTLGDWIIDHPKAPFHERIEILRTLAYGIDDLHRGISALGPIVHGDIKPWNVRVANSGEVKLVDFGQATRYPSTLSTVAISVPYAAPELYTGGSATVFSDRYAFSATAFNVLTGQQLPADIATRPHMLNNSITSQRQELVNSVLQGLAVEPGTRPPCLDICGAGTLSSRMSDIGVEYIAPPPLNSFTDSPTGAGPPPPGSLTNSIIRQPQGAPPPPDTTEHSVPAMAAPPPEIMSDRYSATMGGALPPRKDLKETEQGRLSIGVRYYKSLWSMSDIAAPLLAAASITFISLIIQDPHAWVLLNSALIPLVIAAASLITAVQCGFYAKLYVDVSETTTDTSIVDNKRASIWVNRARRAYDLGIIMLWVGITLGLIPSNGSPIRLAAAAIAGIMAFLEISWALAPIFR